MEAKAVVGDDHRALALWAADCAEHVLPYFEARRPGDDRPRRALESARAWARGEIRSGAARAAAVAAHARPAAAYVATAAPEAEREWQSRRLPEHLRPVAIE